MMGRSGATGLLNALYAKRFTCWAAIVVIMACISSHTYLGAQSVVHDGKAWEIGKRGIAKGQGEAQDGMKDGVHGPDPIDVPATVIETQNKSINIFTILKPNQVEFIKSGFATLMEVSISRKGNSLLAPKTYFTSRCLVKYDIWNEKYHVGKAEDVQSLDKESPRLQVKTLDEKQFVDTCLLADNTKMPDDKQNEILLIDFYAKQIGDENGEKIKEWLIAQQSGIMQGLYSHIVSDVDVSMKDRFVLTPYE